MQKWTKLGRVFDASSKNSWMFSHASMPFVTSIENDVVTVFFSCRNKKQESSIGSVEFNINTLEILSISSNPILA